MYSRYPIVRVKVRTTLAKGVMMKNSQAEIGPNDDINSIKWKALASASTHRNIRPVVVAGDGYKAVLWLSGPWNKFRNYYSDVVGVILETPQ